MIVAEDLAQGARNLLVNCAELERGATVLIAHENPSLGWYDLAAPKAVRDEAVALGMVPTMMEVVEPGAEQPPALGPAMDAHDCTVFFARLGDQDRFEEPVPGRKIVMCYARDAAMLASAYGRTPHQAMRALKMGVDQILSSANRIEITCPLGTELSGTGATDTGGPVADVSVRRFPLGVPTPVAAAGFKGSIALAHYLTPTGSRPYEPAFLALNDVTFADLDAGRITRFRGDPDEVANIEHHYETIAAQFDINAQAVDSWHAGIHPGCAYTAAANRDPDHWSNTVFTNPRFLHFHTCGDYAPGEVCMMVLDPTIQVDGAKLWDNGRLRVLDFDRLASCLDEWPILKSLFENPSDHIGLPNNQAPDVLA